MRKSHDIRKDLIRSLARAEVTLEKMESRQRAEIEDHRASPETRQRLVPPAGIEPATHGLGNRCSSPLSYEGRGPTRNEPNDPLSGLSQGAP
jgi:hypothetical protein